MEGQALLSHLNARKWAIFIAVVLLAVAIESQPLSLVYGISLSFGSVLLFASIGLLQLRYVALGALTVYGACMLAFGHSPFVLVHLAELLAVGLLSRNSAKPLFFWDACFWAVIALPAAFILHVTDHQTSEIVLALLVGAANSMINATLAGIVVKYLPVWIRIAPRTKQPIHLKQALAHFTLFMIFVPYLMYLSIGSANITDTLERNTLHQSEGTASSIKEELGRWTAEEYRSVKLGSDIQIGYLQNMINKYTSEGMSLITVTDNKNRIIADTQGSPYGLKFTRLQADVKKQFNDRFYLTLPANAHTRQTWQDAGYLYIQEVPQASMTIYIDTPLGPFLDSIYEEYFYHFLNLMLCALGVTLLVLLFGRMLTGTITELAATTANLPDRLKRMETLEWPTSGIIEFNSLIQNFQHMSRDLFRLFQESSDANSKLKDQTAKLMVSEEKLQHLAYYDGLTGLPNRLHFSNHLLRVLEEHQQSERSAGQSVAVMFADLNRFKQINDTMGHAAGDELLQRVAERFARYESGQCRIFRLGGDEFVVVLVYEDEALLHETADAICRTFNDAIMIAGTELYISVSLGISVYPRDSRDHDSLLKHADMAMYQAKEQGTSCYRFFDDEMNRYLAEKMQLENGLRIAIRSGEFKLHYQPKVAVATGRISGAEALIRWYHPNLGLIPPDRFIPLAETSGLIAEIDAWVIREACRQNRVWTRQGMPPLPVAVNISGRHFEQGELPQLIRSIADETGMDLSLLTLEITEGIFIRNPDKVVAQLEALRALGLRVSIDDFGTGYSSLNQLQRLPVDEVKLDRTFMKGIVNDPKKSRIVGAIAELLRSLQLHVVVEGIETLEDYRYIEKLECEEAQGYWLSRPLPAEEFASFLQAYAKEDREEIS
ncbi:putative bifunctional diguanylate cyclase/phosphodiesterase [Paenibacillus xanthanilyticus]|uniref:Bifunctional diguanylate cyclase/phosphodiesterase n=1 Tax=Paenibacillus xanthanilyticus TaxID=1783531 RepID=A0ABV8KBG5_9BACL